jgi:hypothetical protein
MLELWLNRRWMHCSHMQYQIPFLFGPLGAIWTLELWFLATLLPPMSLHIWLPSVHFPTGRTTVNLWTQIWLCSQLTWLNLRWLFLEDLFKSKELYRICRSIPITIKICIWKNEEVTIFIRKAYIWQRHVRIDAKIQKMQTVCLKYLTLFQILN